MTRKSLKQNTPKPQKTKFMRSIVIVATETIGLVLLVGLMPGIYISNLTTAIITSIVIILLNAFIRPALLYISMPLTIMTVGLLSLFINGFMIVVASWLVRGFVVDSLWDATLLAIGLAIINALFSAILAIDDTDSYYRNVVARMASKKKKIRKSKKPGVIFLEIDGLAHPIFIRALQNAYMPTLSRWIHSSHTISRWECDLSCQTSASQAGLLHGNNANIPAFRWYDRKRKKIVESHKPEDAMENEEMIGGSKNGLLVNDGISLNNMFSGGADRSVMVISRIKQKDVLKQHSALYFYFLNPYNFVRSILLAILDIISEVKDTWYQKRQDVIPRVQRGGTYPLLRAATTVLLRDVSIHTLIGEMYSGTPVVYTTFVGYDEVAHHAGVERSATMYVLTQLDKQFRKLEYAAKTAPRQYKFVVLSDHGQSQGMTFNKRYNISLSAFIQKIVGKKHIVRSVDGIAENIGHVNLMVADVVQDEDHISGKLMKKAVGSRIENGEIDISKKAGDAKKKKVDLTKSDILVMPSGNLGLLYFLKNKNRLTLEQINRRYPKLVNALSQHEGIGFIMVHSKRHGPVVIGNNGKQILKTGKVIGIDPLKNFGKHAVQHLIREDTFENTPDILINSMYDPTTHEVAAFEGLVGSHGGLGGNQSHPFIMYPKDMTPQVPDGIIGATSVHNIIKQWISAR